MAWPVVEDGFRLEIHRVVNAGKRHHAPFNWQWTYKDGRPAGNITITVAFDGEASGTLALRYTCNGKPFDQRFRLVGEACRFGGQRWFAICPATHRKAAKLYSLGGAGFHARHRYGRVAYQTQRAAKPIDRVLMRRDRILCKKLKGQYPDYVPKPKWMRWKTYHHWKTRLDRAEELCELHLEGLIRRIGGL